MMNRWNCRPKQKRGKSKRAERSIGFSPLIPAKQVHTGGNPFFISVTDIHTVSFGNTPLYISAAPYPFISNGHSCKGGFSALFQGRLRPFFLYLFFPSFLLPDRDSDIDTSHTPFAGSSSDSIFHDAAYMVVKRYIVLAASTPNSRYTFSPDVLPAHLPERERSCVGGRTGLSCFRVRCGLFRLDFFATAFYLKSPYRFSLQS